MGNFMSRIIPKFLSFFKPSGAMPALHEVITPTRILVLGGSYGGLSTALNLHDLCSGKQARVTLHKPAVGAPGPRIPIEITIVDERDGYCEFKRGDFVSGRTDTGKITSSVHHLLWHLNLSPKRHG